MESDASGGYRHTQVGAALLWGLALLAAVVGVVVYREAGRLAAALPMVAILILTAVVFASLTVTVGERGVRLSFGPGLIHRTFAAADITGARAVRNRWWYGWGIHLTPHGWLYNVAGLDAVELDLRNGRKVRIGTDEPQRLLAAIQQLAELQHG
jgi:hypothetical protein